MPVFWALTRGRKQSPSHSAIDALPCSLPLTQPHPHPRLPPCSRVLSRRSSDTWENLQVWTKHPSSSSPVHGEKEAPKIKSWPSTLKKKSPEWSGSSEGSVLRLFTASYLLTRSWKLFSLFAHNKGYWRSRFKFFFCLLWKMVLNKYLCPRRVHVLWASSSGAIPLPGRPLSEQLLSKWFQVIDTETWIAALVPVKKIEKNSRRKNWNRFLSECPGTVFHPISP